MATRGDAIAFGERMTSSPPNEVLLTMLNHEIRFAILCMMGNIDVEKFNLQEAIKTECAD